MGGERWGASIGAVFGLVFFLVNAGAMPAGVAPLVRVVGVVGFLAVVALLVGARRHPARRSPPDQRAWRTYWTMVGIEVVLLLVGTITLTRVGYPKLGVAWVALVVGVHFLPFARAFRAEQFRVLGLTLIGLGLVGGLLAVTVGAAAGALVAGILSGVVLYGFALEAVWGSWPRSRSASASPTDPGT